MWNLAFKNIKEIWRDKKILVTSLLFPIVLLIISQFILKHASFFTENIPLAVVNPENNFPQAGRLLVLSLKQATSSATGHPLYAIDEMDEKQALAKLQTGEVTGALLIPRGFTPHLASKKSEKLSLILNDGDPRAAMLAGSITAIANHFGELVNRSQKGTGENPLSVSTVKQGAGNPPPEYESLANITLFAFLFLIPYAAGQWVSEIERGSLTRFRLALIPVRQLFGGVFLSTLFLAFFQSALLVTAAFLLNLRPYLLVLWIWPLAAIMALASMGLGMILSSFAEKEKQLNLLSTLVLIPLFILCGSLGKEMIGTRWTPLLPWSQGYSVLSRLLAYQSVDGRLLAHVTASSLILAVAGTVLFSVRRLRYA